MNKYKITFLNKKPTTLKADTLEEACKKASELYKWEWVTVEAL